MYTGTDLENWTLESLNQESRCKRVQTYHDNEIVLMKRHCYNAELMIF